MDLDIYRVGVSVHIIDEFTRGMAGILGVMSKAEVQAATMRASVEAANPAFAKAMEGASLYSSRLGLLGARYKENELLIAAQNTRLGALTEAQNANTAAGQAAIEMGQARVVVLERQNALIAAQAAELNKAAAAESHLNKGRATAMLVGGAIVAYGSYEMVKKATESAAGYKQALTQMQEMGMPSSEVREHIRAAWEVSQEVQSLSVTDALKMITDIRAITGKPEEADKLAPWLARNQAILQASSDMEVRAKAGDFAYSAMKALDIMGLGGNETKLREYGDAMTRAMQFSRGRVTPEAFQAFMKWGAQATYGLSSDFIQSYLPTMLMEFQTAGGGTGSRGGVGPMLASAYQSVITGVLPKVSLAMFDRMGLLERGGSLKPDLKSMTNVQYTGGLIGKDVFTQNPVEWTRQFLLPAVRKTLPAGLTPEAREKQEILAINQLFRNNRRVAQFFDMTTKMLETGQIDRDVRQARSTISRGAAFKAAQESPAYVHTALLAQWENTKVVLGNEILPVVIRAARELSDGLGGLALIFRDHPWLADATVWTVVGAGLAGTGMAVLGAIGFMRIGLAGLRGDLYRTGVAAEAAAGGESAGGITSATRALSGFVGGLSSFTLVVTALGASLAATAVAVNHFMAQAPEGKLFNPLNTQDTAWALSHPGAVGPGGFWLATAPGYYGTRLPMLNPSTGGQFVPLASAHHGTSADKPVMVTLHPNLSGLNQGITVQGGLHMVIQPQPGQDPGAIADEVQRRLVAGVQRAALTTPQASPNTESLYILGGN